MERNMRKCPKCGRDSYVTDSRLTEKGLLARRRICEECGFRWSTAEIPYKLGLLAINFANEIEEMKK